MATALELPWRDCDRPGDDCESFSSWVQVYEALRRLTSSSADTTEEEPEQKVHSVLDAADVDSNASTSEDGWSQHGLSSDEPQEEYSGDEGDHLSIDEEDALTLEGVSEQTSANCIEAFGAKVRNVGHALALQRELLEAFRRPLFQSELLLLLRESGGPEASQCLEGRTELCVDVAEGVLLAHGFPCNGEGLMAALQVLEAFAPSSGLLRRGTDEVRDSIGLAPGGLAAVPWSA
mmetsp:Transcript_25002/g.56708  ORF Transcript_25002/g.56708 Transcript_25002/m.56708 type:complete len:234 (+) Transcript_25002:134-835(+)